MENTGKFHPNPQLKLMDQVRETLRYYHYAYRTEQTYEPLPIGRYLLCKLSYRFALRVIGSGGIYCTTR
jgi:hypothetical protein